MFSTMVSSPFKFKAFFTRHTFPLLATMVTQSLILGFGWGFMGALWYYQYMALPDWTVKLILEYPTTMTLVVSLISTVLSVITTSLLAFSMKEALRHDLAKGISLFGLRAAIALTKPTWIICRDKRHWKYVLLTGTVFAMMTFLNSCWNTLLLPTLIEWSVTLSGTELDISNSAFNDILSALLLNNSAQSTYTKAFETLDITALFSGASAASYDAGVRTSSIFNYNGVSYSESTNGLLPAVNDSDYSGSPVAQTAVGLAFTSGFVPINTTIDLGRHRFGSPPQGLGKNYTVTQQGLTAEVNCQERNISVYSYSANSNNFSVSFPTGDSIGLTMWEVVTECPNGNSSMLYSTFANATTLDMNPDTEGFLPTVVCPQPGAPGFSPYTFDILMAGRAKYAFLPTTVCEVVLYVTTVDVTYDQGIVSAAVTDRRPFEDSNMALTEFIASAIMYQAENNQGFQANVIGDYLTAYVDSNSTDAIFRQMEDYWRGVVEFSGTFLRSGFSATGGLPWTEIPSHMSVVTNGTMFVNTYGWEEGRPIYLFLFVIFTLIWLVTVIAAGFSLRKELQHPRGGGVMFDYCDPIHLITAAAAGGLEGKLYGLEHPDCLKRNEEIEIRYVEEGISQQGRMVKKRLEVVSRPELQPTMQMPVPEPHHNTLQIQVPDLRRWHSNFI
ncbi:hypothetical protein DEU56DRAFT_556152 [Suillus clintonianus]|uniref:uncharacterized protein n=1 Tax=Suillus clintonianus TaxID=1904413 RepID=UPI001B86C5D6|nr:uncharacterized protein DEU56DRAFT_556152 [Suillus clintonianus]KAG2126215.1 hypothetical protein DEU56DRAFT_556152 [Suillus clintonianus]